MEDVNPDVVTPSGEGAGSETTPPQPSEADQAAVETNPPTTGAPVPPGIPKSTVPETIPYSRFSQEVQRRKEVERKLAEATSKRQLESYDPNDIDKVLSHPLVQELMLKQAKAELTDYAKGLLDQYPTIPEPVKKAILKNVRGFVNEGTQDIETAKLDIEDYITSLSETGQIPSPAGAPNSGQVVVSPSNAGLSKGQARPAEISKILSKPVDEWTDEETKKIDDYSKK